MQIPYMQLILSLGNILRKEHNYFHFQQLAFLFFLLLCPKLNIWFPELGVTSIWNPEIGIGYIFIAMFVASLFNLILLLPDLIKIQWQFDKALLRKVLKYASPILVVSIAAQVNLNVDKILMPKLISDASEALAQTGIYGANFKLAVIMTLFIQAFRFAFEPFFFSQNKDENSKKLYADVLKYFVIFGLLIFMGVMFYIDIVKILIAPEYHEGLGIVPYVLLANFFLGIFFSLIFFPKIGIHAFWNVLIPIAPALVVVAVGLWWCCDYIGSEYYIGSKNRLLRICNSNPSWFCINDYCQFLSRS